MITKMFTVFDSKAGCYMAPFFSVSTGVAIRQFTDIANTPGSDINKHPEDYTLFEIGSFNDEHCQIETTAAHSLACAIEVIKPAEQAPLLQAME